MWKLTVLPSLDNTIARACELAIMSQLPALGLFLNNAQFVYLSWLESHQITWTHIFEAQDNPLTKILKVYKIESALQLFSSKEAKYQPYRKGESFTSLNHNPRIHS